MKNSKRRFLSLCMVFSLSCNVFSAYAMTSHRMPVSGVRINSSATNGLFRSIFKAVNVVAFCGIVTYIAASFVKSWFFSNNNQNRGNNNSNNDNPRSVVPPVKDSIVNKQPNQGANQKKLAVGNEKVQEKKAQESDDRAASKSQIADDAVDKGSQKKAGSNQADKRARKADKNQGKADGKSKDDDSQGDALKKLEEAKQQKKAQFIVKEVDNIPDYVIPYVLDARRQGNVVYLQLDAINQFDRNVVAPVSKHRNDLIQGMLQEKKKEKFADLSSADKEKANDFSSGGTCPSQSIRNARLLAQFLRSENENQELGALSRINNVDDAKEYLQNLVDNGKKTSWLGTEEIYRRIEEEQLDHDVSLMDSVLMSEGQFDVEKMKLRYGDDRSFHIFIINTGDITALGEIDQARQRINQKKELNLARSKTMFLERQQAGRGHYYVAAIQKRGDDIFYYTINTVRDEDHVNNPVFSYRDRYLCENMLNINPKLNFRNYLRNYSEALIDGYIEHGVIKIDAKKGKGKKGKKKLPQVQPKNPKKDIEGKKLGRKRSNSL